MRILSKNEEAFCVALLEQKSATDAYLQAYPNFKGTRKTAGEYASRLCKKSKIVARLKELADATAKPTIAKLSELGEFWTKVFQDEKQEMKDRLNASRVLAEYNFKFFEYDSVKERQQGPAQNGQIRAPQDITFVEFCIRCGYPPPFEKQIEMLNFAFKDGPGLLLGARGYGKTDYIAVCGIAYMLFKDPLLTFLLMTKEERRGKDIVGEVARCLEVFGIKFGVQRSDQISILGHTDKDANLVALPLRSKSLRGRHPKYILCDDIITPDDVGAAEREKVTQVVAELFKLTSNICLMGQPAHIEDIYADMRGRSGIRRLEVPYGSIPQLDHDLEAQRAAGVSEASIDASYFLKISATEKRPFGDLLKVDFFPSEGSAGMIDPADDGEDSTAFVVGAMFGDQFIAAGFEFEKPWDLCVSEIQAISKAYKTGRFAFENNKLGNHPVRLLRGLGANVTAWNTTETVSGRGAGQGKHGRILNAATMKGHIKLSNHIPPEIRTPELVSANQLFIKNCIAYEAKAKKKDAADSLANLLIYLQIIKR